MGRQRQENLFQFETNLGYTGFKGDLGYIKQKLVYKIETMFLYIAYLGSPRTH